MDILSNLMQGFATCLTPYNLWMAALGCFFGTLVGILPGLGASATIAMLLPITFGMDATPAMIMICAIYYGAMVPLFASLLRIPYALLYPAILIVCVIGAYFMKKADIPAAPMLPALLLGPMIERSLYQALNLSHGNMMTFLTHPISATLLAICAIMCIAIGFKSVRKTRSMIQDEEAKILSP